MEERPLVDCWVSLAGPPEQAWAAGRPRNKPPWQADWSWSGCSHGKSQGGPHQGLLGGWLGLYLEAAQGVRSVRVKPYWGCLGSLAGAVVGAGLGFGEFMGQAQLKPEGAA